MEVFIKDELKKEYELDNDYTYIACKGNVIYPNLKSLDNHDKKVREEERNKVVAELQEWNNKLIDEGYIIDYEDFEQKLKDLKGE